MNKIKTTVLWMLFDTWKAKKEGLKGIETRQSKRLADIVAFARANSPYYQELYQELPKQIEDPTCLPVTSKKELMEHFNDFVTDPEVTIEKAQAFVGNPEFIGVYFLNKYTVATTSGTTGKKGIFLIDERSFKVVGALAFRMMISWLGLGDFIRILVNRGRLTMINAMGGHFASAIAAVRLKKKRDKRYQVLPVNMPIPDMVKNLNQFQPIILAPYASMGPLLASEQEAGRLHINPSLIVLSAEGLPEKEYQRISRALNAKVYDSYAATECPFISYRCRYGWLHVNSDWVILEPVDEDYKPTPPGKQSYTVLLTNLANKIQPILRYDLGDSILQKPEPCKCGNPLPAIRVQGRSSDVLTFPADGEKVSIAPLAFSTVAARIPGIDLFQLVQTCPTNLRIRLKLSAGAEPERIWQTILAELAGVLKENRLENITLEKAEELPEQTSGGKVREVIPLK
ncbi:phenylacetate--CoA ligase family protein [Algoriphagus sp. AGSA1]|jgi:phenylacetate-CoA ligase|uniref:phenylacetate--CoA ligase family protein n=1 Tax=Algoriphagus sp. AGSA1 TaxID=2907213 RepID=UPI001F367F0E|nr:phenylacetate--CoA ligase family protein [Algoriphagus sp. AGSA1]MCE7056506.1 phenylacetate--CoA ligase family protein [Algoriphagus sp. AGSA1]|tara:strand:- start:241 stop:1608 length:1368 start_codon:yes stop_codon:yes gene_type:complete